MNRQPMVAPTILTIFGAGGDLTWRKLVPSLYALHHDGSLPERFAVIGVDQKPMREDEFRDRALDGTKRFGRYGAPSADVWQGFATELSYVTADPADPQGFAALARKLAAVEREWGEPATRAFYLAVPPQAIQLIVHQMAKAKLTLPRDHVRVVFEKPFGHDLESARALNAMLGSTFEEHQIYRIDHYLGKETVQNILAFRFANGVFEPIWNRRYIDHVQITVAEDVGIGHRGPYYEHAGALRDMVQNHLLQVLCLVAMEPPVSFQADEIRSRKVDVLRAIRPVPNEMVHEVSVRGQYGPGWIRGQQVPGYRAESGVSADSQIETFAAVQLMVDNWRWQDVPFYLRTGKRMPVRVSEVSIQFKPVPHRAFPAPTAGYWEPNRLALRIQPDEGMMLRLQAKLPGQEMRLSPVEMQFRYKDAFKTSVPEAYETLLRDVMVGDATLFMRADQVEAAWAVITPVLEVWSAVPPADFPNYAAGTWGPREAEGLIAKDGRSWVQPTDIEFVQGLSDEEEAAAAS